MRVVGRGDEMRVLDVCILQELGWDLGVELTVKSREEEKKKL